MGSPNPSGMGMGFNFSSPLGMGRVTGKYVRIGYGDGEGKTHPHPAPLPCLGQTYCGSIIAWYFQHSLHHFGSMHLEKLANFWTICAVPMCTFRKTWIY